jgi:DNA modification methylase
VTDRSKKARCHPPGETEPVKKSRSGAGSSLAGNGAELVWDGKYDKNGRRREVAAAVAVPFHVVETIDGPRAAACNDGSDRAERGHGVEVKDSGRGTSCLGIKDDFRNKLIQGDNKSIMASLIDDFSGKIDLIYIDPPFDIGSDVSVRVPVGQGGNRNGASDSREMVAYRDVWGRDTESYAQMMYERLMLMRELLSERGSLYVHCDYRTTGLLRNILDEVFGPENFINEVIWYYKTGGNPKKIGFSRKHDTIHFYTKTKRHAIWHTQKEKSYLRHRYGFSNIKINEDDRGKYTMVTCRDVFDIPALRGNQPERVDFPTQKPEGLLERVIRASSDEDSIVADFFCGSGTTGAVAERLGRRWIMSDLEDFAIHTARKRLVEAQCKHQASSKAYRIFDVLRARPGAEQRLEASAAKTPRPGAHVARGAIETVSRPAVLHVAPVYAHNGKSNTASTSSISGQSISTSARVGHSRRNGWIIAPAVHGG